MPNSEHFHILRSGVEAWNRWRLANPAIVPDLNGIDRNLIDEPPRQAFEASPRGPVNLNGINLRNADLRLARLSGCDLVNADLSDSLATEIGLQDSNLTGARLAGANLADAHFGDANLSGATFAGAFLKSASFGCASAIRADFKGADIRGANFENVDLRQADLRHALADRHTRFDLADVRDMQIDRYTFECLGRERGLMTTGQQMGLKLEDGVATLREGYSGFWQWFHLIALAFFVFPYGSFLLKHWAIARFHGVVEGDTISLLNALWNFVYTGGQNWHAPEPFSVTFVVFWILLTYNLVRLVLLWKAKTLELRQTTIGVPARFSLAGGWGKLLLAARALFWVNVLLVLWHTAHFLSQRIPVSR